jgi:hypothetical protein
MKRTRRIEITRYRRKVAVIQGEPSVAEVAEEGREVDLILDVLKSIPPIPQEVGSSALVPRDVESGNSPRRWSLLKLGRLLRPRKRV